MSPELFERLLDRAIATVQANTELLTQLDQAIGDGDHGLNLNRGFSAIAEQKSELRAMAPGAAVQKAGLTLVMKVGGASGPLYGSLLMTAGKALAEPIDGPSLVAAWQAGIEAVKARGKSTVGEKTLLDVHVPCLEALKRGLAAGLDRVALAAAVKTAAEAACAATGPMKATKGRASFLGERSIGPVDPGARSSALLISALAEVLMESV